MGLWHWENWLVASCVSLCAAGLLTVMSCKTRKKESRAVFFSASLGIIIFLCVKSMLIDCGWEYAALFGVAGGGAAQLAMTVGALAMWCEAEKLSIFSEGFPRDSLPYLPVVCFGVGRHWLHSAAMGDCKLYAMGEGMEFSLVLWAMLHLRGETETENTEGIIVKVISFTLFKAVICAVSWVSEGNSDGNAEEFLGTALLTAGAAGLLVAFTKALRVQTETVPGGFAAGFLTALCVSTLLG